MQLLLSVASEDALGPRGGGGPHDPAAGESPDLGESPAVEVFQYREKNGYFGQSPTVRDPKPPHVQFRVGQVIKHKR